MWEGKDLRNDFSDVWQTQELEVRGWQLGEETLEQENSGGSFLGAPFDAPFETQGKQG